MKGIIGEVPFRGQSTKIGSTRKGRKEGRGKAQDATLLKVAEKRNRP